MHFAASANHKRIETSVDIVCKFAISVFHFREFRVAIKWVIYARMFCDYHCNYGAFVCIENVCDSLEFLFSPRARFLRIFMGAKAY